MAAQSIRTVQELPDGSYRVCSSVPANPPLGALSGTCFLFRKQGNRVIGTYRVAPGDPTAWCMEGTAVGSEIRGFVATTGTLPETYLINSLLPDSQLRLLSPFLRVANIQVRQLSVRPDTLTVSLVPFGAPDPRGQPVRINMLQGNDEAAPPSLGDSLPPLVGEIRYNTAVLDLSTFYLYNLGNVPPPTSCQPNFG
ncbi:hypothetical protein L3556_16170 [Candidatus Synechococcus calcipolaris G9]|uniref:Uncharacterized protein n=1 Tax=Candidatus Synechococcus calcipolaris G9 TaxID=1497997 RepID=A0ABT6F3L8_9SYNE|nr:hypothetical protein [Candidatus Synechococcus calcipolaris]MDG2992455.1 hypothetical protein [Candidatus Synechococcus calcipolaris G9]